MAYCYEAESKGIYVWFCHTLNLDRLIRKKKGNPYFSTSWIKVKSYYFRCALIVIIFNLVVLVQNILDLFKDNLNMFLNIFVVVSTDQFALTAIY